MPARSIASLSITFGLVSIPIKLYSATENSTAIRFKLMGAGGSRLRQQYVSDEPAPPASGAVRPQAQAIAEPDEVEPQKPAGGRSAAAKVLDFPARAQVPIEEPPPVAIGPAVVERSDMVKGYEFEKGKFVLFTAEELKALEGGSRGATTYFIPQGGPIPPGLVGALGKFWP